MRIRITIPALLFAAILLGVCVLPLLAQTTLSPSITIPPSSVASTTGANVRAHTNILLGLGPLTGVAEPSGGPPYPGYFYETPASIACIYELLTPITGCNPYEATTNPSGGSRAIAIVDAYDYSAAAASDMGVFTSQFGVAPAVNFEVVYAAFGGATPGSCTGSATQPPSASGTGWDLEESLDIEYSHAMAPGATLYLVEAQSSYYTDLLCAVSTASTLVAAAGGGEVSMSWGGGEPAYFLYPQYPETTMDPVFTQKGVVYFASSGDGPGTLYPSVSPNVVAVGGTTLSTYASTGNFRVEESWPDGGGGMSLVEPRPTFQDGISSLVGLHRGVPDISAIANPYTGVWVYNSTLLGFGAWWIVGGTSVASPLMAGIVNSAGSFSASSSAELTKIYSNPEGFADIKYGPCGLYMDTIAVPGWDICTGWGSPRTYADK